MTDARRRELERLAAAGDVDAEERLTVLELRAGERKVRPFLVFADSDGLLHLVRPARLAGGYTKRFGIPERDHNWNPIDLGLRAQTFCKMHMAWPHWIERDGDYQWTAWAGPTGILLDGRCTDCHMVINRQEKWYREWRQSIAFGRVVGVRHPDDDKPDDEWRASDGMDKPRYALPQGDLLNSPTAPKEFLHAATQATQKGQAPPQGEPGA